MPDVKRFARANALLLVLAMLAPAKDSDAHGNPHPLQPTVREAAPGLPFHTVYRPQDLARVDGAVPVLLWGNGACKASNLRYWDVLGTLAAHGYVVVAYGDADAESDMEKRTVTPQRMQDALHWLAHEARSQPGYEQLDAGRVGVVGTSCGGLEALVAGADARVGSVGALNTGFFATGHPMGAALGGYVTQDVKHIRAPTLFVVGGPTDIAHPQAVANFHAARAPVVLANNPAGGHSGFWAGIRTTTDANDPSRVLDQRIDYTITHEAVEVLVRWFDWTLKGDAGQGDYFLGPECGLCTVPGWRVTSRNF